MSPLPTHPCSPNHSPGGVGKSAITNRFVIGRWIEKYDPTIEESYQTTVDIDGKALQVEILDTAGQDEYRPLRETFMHTGDGFLLVYSITDDQTFEELRGIREQILRALSACNRDKKVHMPFPCSLAYCTSPQTYAPPSPPHAPSYPSVSSLSIYPSPFCNFSSFFDRYQS